jgi:hypothetical protein
VASSNSYALRAIALKSMNFDNHELCIVAFSNFNVLYFSMTNIRMVWEEGVGGGQ